MSLPPVTVPAYYGLGIFLRFYLACSLYNSLVLVYDGRHTGDLATAILAVSSSTPRSNWLTFDLSSNRPRHSGPMPSAKTNDSQALFVWLLPHAQSLATDLALLRNHLQSNERCDNLLVTADVATAGEIGHLLHYIEAEHIINVALVQDVGRPRAEVLKLNYELGAAVPFAPRQCCAPLLFYEKTTEWAQRELLLFMFMEPPFVINLTRMAREADGTEREVYNVGGTYAYIGSLIDERFGTHSTNIALKKSNQYRHLPEVSLFAKEYMEKPYREDIRQPHWLPYDLLNLEDWDAYTSNRTVISFEKQIFDKPGTYSLYPHAFETYILCVPNQPHERSTLWSSLLCFPLFYVWTFVIATITLLRTVLRKLQGLGGQSVADMLFHTCGMSFGAVSTVRVENRPERVLLLFLSVFTMISGILCAGLLFQKFTTKVAEPDIDSLEQLGQRPFLNVIMPEEFAPETEQWLSEQIPNHIERMDKNFIQSMIFAQNTSAAYVVSESSSAILLNRIEMLDERGYNLFHELKYTIVSQQIRFVVPAWYMIRRFSALLQQTIEHGFMQYFEMRTQDVLRYRSVGHLGQRSSPYNDNALVMLPMDELWFVFVIYALGVSCGMVAFIGEMILFHLRMRRARRLM